jgi:hypothetical protein
MKPVYFELQKVENKRADGTKYTTAKPIYVKYSSVVLTDDLVKQFPKLKQLRDKMEQAKVGELTFRSAVKTGAPTKEAITLDDFLNSEETPDIAILELSNRHYRFQHNAASDPEKAVAIFSQLMYFLNLQEANPENYEAARIAYQMVAELIAQGREQFLEKISTDAKIRNLLLQKFNGPGAERALDLLQSGLSLSQPLLEKKAAVALASELASDTIKIKFSGGKLVLQSSEGALLNDTISEEVKELSYGTTVINGQEVMYAEVILPREMLTEEQIAQIGKEPLFIYGDGIGFRIPSTELHSAIPLKVVGIYASKGANIIIAPKELVPIHGSDFDVDALFIIKREIFSVRDSSFTPAAALLTSLDSYAELQKDIEEAIADISDPEDQAILNKFYEATTKKIKLILDPNSLDESATDPLFQKNTQAEYEQFIATPNYSRKHKAKVIRIEQPDFNASVARREFGNRKGLLFEKGQWIKLDSEILSIVESLNSEIRRLQQSHSELIEKNKSLQKLIKNAEKLRSQVSNSLEELSFGDENAPVGYNKSETGIYIFNEKLLPELDTHLTDLSNLLAGLPTEFAHIFAPKIKKEIAKLRSIRSKYLKNYVTETMLRTISAKQNMYRMITPISFNPITEAIDNIRQHVPERDLDLSDISHKQ